VSRTHLAIRVELVSGRGEDVWPRPGRVFLTARAFTFGQLATVLDAGFGRWDLAHLYAFDLADSLLIGPGDAWDDPPQGRPVHHSDRTRLSRLAAGEQLVCTFDLGDDWTHLCTVEPSRVDPLRAYGSLPDRPVPLWGWGSLPDQYGRRFDGDLDDTDPLPARPDLPLGGLPPLLPWWGPPPPPPA
jgi:hypothetical protein